MPRGKRIVRGFLDQDLHIRVQPAWPRPCNEIFQNHIAQQYACRQPARCQQPYSAVISQHRDLRHQNIQRRAGQRVAEPMTQSEPAISPRISQTI